MCNYILEGLNKVNFCSMMGISLSIKGVLSTNLQEKALKLIPLVFPTQ